jgi:superfamily II DNA or RNA helicase
MSKYFYVVDLGISFIENNTSYYKIGITHHPESRKWQYNILCIKPPKYKYLFRIITNISEYLFYNLDNTYFIEYLKRLNLYDKYYASLGGGTELYYDIPLNILQDYFTSLNIEIEILPDIYSERPERQVYKKHKKIDKNGKKNRLTLNLKNKEDFKNILGSKNLRSIQDILWEDIYETLDRDENIFGIIQWPVGVGKTVGILIVVYLIKQRLEKLGQYLNSILISPKRDIIKTLRKEFDLLENYGIKVIYSSEPISKIVLPENTHYLLVITHSGMNTIIDDKPFIETLKNINLVLYDEVHRICGEYFYDSLKKMITKWQLKYLIGTSATPLTCNKTQNKKLIELCPNDNGDNIKLVSYCSIKNALDNEWIARPKINLFIFSNKDTIIDETLNIINDLETASQFRNKKIICYSSSSVESMENYHALFKLSDKTKEWFIYNANNDDNIDNFINNVYSKPQILFACQKYREGSNIYGVDMVNIIIEQTIEPHLLLQIGGRAMRMDYKNKIATINIFKRYEPTDKNALNILYEIVSMINDEYKYNNHTISTKCNLNKIIEDLVGVIKIDGETLDHGAAVSAVESIYIKRQLDSSPKLKYTMLVDENRILGLKSKNEYFNSREGNKYFIDDPQTYFTREGLWINWCHFLGVDTSNFLDLDNWKKKVKSLNITTINDYINSYMLYPELPPRPNEFYNNFTNWSDELDIVDSTW